VHDRLDVERLPCAANPILFAGSERDTFSVQPGEFFVIGETSFHWGERPTAAEDDPPDAREAGPAFAFTMDMAEVRDRASGVDRLRLLDLMELPVVLRTKSRSEFFVYACGLLRLASGAEWVRVVRQESDELLVLAEDAVDDRPITKSASRRLVEAAVAESPKPVTHCWTHAAGDVAAGGSAIDATACEGADWAVCCAMPVPGEPHVVFYLAGATATAVGSSDMIAGADLTLRDTARLVGLVADMVSRAMSMQTLESWQSRLGQFFSDKVVSEILASKSDGALKPRKTDATVMFYDIGGFSLRTEQNLNRIIEFTAERRNVLNAVAGRVIEHDGVVIAYVGDGMLACWNVPQPIGNHAEQACLAAIEMDHWMRTESGGWTCRIGLASGEIVAGWLGTDQKEQYDILGPIVNQASRIEGIAKKVGVSILVTETVATQVSADTIVTRRVARFRPAGMTESVDLYTIDRTPDSPDGRAELASRFDRHQKGLEAFERGDWEESFRLLHPIVEHDAAALYVYTLTLEGKRTAPDGWNGVIELDQK